MLSLRYQNWLRLVVWLFLGLIVYVFYGRKNSRRRGVDFDRMRNAGTPPRLSRIEPGMYGARPHTYLH